MKRVISLVFVLTLLFSISVSAQVTYEAPDSETAVTESSEKNLEKVEAIVDKANQRIEKKINNTVEKSQRIVTKFEDGKLTEADKDAKIDELITDLIDKTNAVSQKSRTRCEKLGYTVECEWIEVEIDGNVVMVDPLIIIGDRW